LAFPSDTAPLEIMRRYNAFPELMEALHSLVQTIEWQAEGNFLNKDAEEGEENSLTDARTILRKYSGK